jgi:hypothetical protein
VRHAARFPTAALPAFYAPLSAAVAATSFAHARAFPTLFRCAAEEESKKSQTALQRHKDGWKYSALTEAISRNTETLAGQSISRTKEEWPMQTILKDPAGAKLFSPFGNTTPAEGMDLREPLLFKQQQETGRQSESSSGQARL